MIYFLMSIFVIFAQEEIPDPNADITAPAEDSITLLASHSYSCGSDDVGKHCARNLVYDKGTNELHVFLSDNRKKEYGDIDINNVLRDPASYGGQLTSFLLDTEFDTGGRKITNLNASFTKNLDVKIKIIVNGKSLKKIIPVPKN